MKQNYSRNLTRMALVAALLCILGPLTLPIPFSPVPISLIHIGIYLGVYALGARQATVAVLLYLLIGAAGLPVFSGFGGGLQKLAGPTGGYLIGYLFLAIVGGLFVDREKGRPRDALGLLLGNACMYALGTIWLSLQTGLGAWAALLAGVIPYLPLDAIKFFAALAAGPKVRRTLRKQKK